MWSKCHLEEMKKLFNSKDPGFMYVTNMLETAYKQAMMQKAIRNGDEFMISFMREYLSEEQELIVAKRSILIGEVKALYYRVNMPIFAIAKELQISEEDVKKALQSLENFQENENKKTRECVLQNTVFLEIEK